MDCRIKWGGGHNFTCYQKKFVKDPNHDFVFVFLFLLIKTERSSHVIISQFELTLLEHFSVFGYDAFHVWRTSDFVRNLLFDHSSNDNLRLHWVCDTKLVGKKCAHHLHAFLHSLLQRFGVVRKGIAGKYDPADQADHRLRGIRMNDRLGRPQKHEEKMALLEEVHIFVVDMDPLHMFHEGELVQQRKIRMIHRSSKRNQLVLVLKGFFGIHNLIHKLRGKCVEHRACRHDTT